MELLRETSVYYGILSCAICALAIFPVLSGALGARRRKIDLSGPRGWPFIGIGLDLPQRPRRMLNEYRTKYGDAFKVRIGWYDWVFFNTPEGVREVFERQVSRTELDR